MENQIKEFIEGLSDEQLDQLQAITNRYCRRPRSHKEEKVTETAIEDIIMRCRNTAMSLSGKDADDYMQVALWLEELKARRSASGDWYRIERDSMGFATEDCLDTMFGALPIEVLQIEEETEYCYANKELLLVEEGDTDLRGEIDRHRKYAYWRSVKLPEE